MARGRMLQNRISKSQKLAALSSDTVRLLYTWLLSHLDINGNFYADPVMVNNLVFTRLGHSVKVVASALDELVDAGLIVRYQVNNETYLNYPDFQDKQPKLNPDREGDPDIPIVTPESLVNNSCVTQTQIKISKDKISKVKCSNDGFEDFWKTYPRKVNKKEAITSWNKAKIPSLEIIINAIIKQKTSDQWTKDNGQYIPYPSSWLNKERWNDELTYGGNNGNSKLNAGKRIYPQGRELSPEAAESADAITREYLEKKKISAVDGSPKNTAGNNG